MAIDMVILQARDGCFFFSVYYKPDEADQRRSFTSGDRSTSTTSPRPGEESSTNCPSSMDYLFNEW